MAESLAEVPCLRSGTVVFLFGRDEGSCIGVSHMTLPVDIFFYSKDGGSVLLKFIHRTFYKPYFTFVGTGRISSSLLHPLIDCFIYLMFLRSNVFYTLPLKSVESQCLCFWKRRSMFSIYLLLSPSLESPLFNLTLATVTRRDSPVKLLTKHSIPKRCTYGTCKLTFRQ